MQCVRVRESLTSGQRRDPTVVVRAAARTKNFFACGAQGWKLSASEPASQFPIACKKLGRNPVLSFQRLVSKTQYLTVCKQYIIKYKYNVTELHCYHSAEHLSPLTYGYGWQV